MKIETKFEVLQQIYFISDAKKVCRTMIQGIKIEISKIEGEGARVWNQEVVYLCNSEGDQRVNIKVKESAAFISKEELIQSL